MNIKEKRGSARLEVACDIYCKSVGDEQSYEALCITLSSTGISFVCRQPFEIGANVEVSIVPAIKAMSAAQFFITIVRCQVNSEGDFDIGARIYLPDEISE